MDYVSLRENLCLRKISQVHDHLIEREGGLLIIEIVDSEDLGIKEVTFNGLPDEIS